MASSGGRYSTHNWYIVTGKMKSKIDKNAQNKKIK